MSPAEPAPLSPEDFAAIRGHPQFAATVEQHAAGNLARYAALSPIDRWAMSDLGRTALTATVTIMAAQHGVTLAGVLAAAAWAGFASPGRARAYIETALAKGLMAPVEAGAALRADTPLRASDRLLIVATRSVAANVRSAARLAPEAAPALARLDDLGFCLRVAERMGMLAVARPELFPGRDRPIHLFQGRDGGARMLDELIGRQPPGRARLLETCELSQSALARASFCSRRHVERLLKDGVAIGLLRLDDRRLTAAPELSEDVERHYAAAFAVSRVAALAALAEA